MRIPLHDSPGESRLRRPHESALTLMEVLVAMSIFMLVMVTTMNYFCVTGRALSGSTTQCNINTQGAYAFQLIQNRVRLATLVSNSTSGNTLTIGLDDNPAVDSNGDGVTWNDQDHFERFQVRNIGSTNSPTNAMIYIPDITKTNETVLIKSGVLNLPGWNYFTVTNTATVLIRFGITDNYSNDYYQSFQVQGAALALNHKVFTNSISILPY